MRKIYFAGSIRGGRADAKLYHDLIQEMQKTDIVLTEHVGDLKKSIPVFRVSHHNFSEVVF